jgi:hypothetical protein
MLTGMPDDVASPEEIRAWRAEFEAAAQRPLRNGSSSMTSVVRTLRFIPVPSLPVRWT